MAQKGLSHIALKARDLKKTEEFYIGVLGLQSRFPPSAEHDFSDHTRQRRSIELCKERRRAHPGPKAWSISASR